MKAAFPALMLATAVLAACGAARKPTSPGDMMKSEFGPSGIPPQFRKNGPGGTPVAPGGNQRNPANTKFTPMDELVMTDADNPYKNIPELDGGIGKGAKTKEWEESDAQARARAAREGKSILIWFTNTKSKMGNAALDSELLQDPKFRNWANEKLVRLKFDCGYEIRNSNRPADLNLDISASDERNMDVRKYAERMQKQYKVMGTPALLVLNPMGSVVSRLPGYRPGQAATVFGQIKHAESLAAKAYAEWRSALEKKGYREWNDNKGNRIFAKLTGYNDGDIRLVDPGGSAYRTREEKLSDGDRAWITEQKKLRNMQ